METNNDYQNRLPEHPAPLELSGHVESPTAASGAAGGEHISRAVGGGRRHGGGYVGWAWLTALAVAVLVCSIYWFSGHAQKNNDNNVNIAQTSAGNANADAVLIADYTVTQSAAAGQSARPVAAAKTRAATADAPQDVVYLFPLNGAKITNDAVLNELAKKVSDTGAYVSVVAYTDESGRAEYNCRLSERRAKEVGDYLIAHGVPADHVKTQGLGPTHAYPTAAQDRRAEVHVTYVN